MHHLFFVVSSSRLVASCDLEQRCAAASGQRRGPPFPRLQCRLELRPFLAGAGRAVACGTRGSDAHGGRARV